MLKVSASSRHMKIWVNTRRQYLQFQLLDNLHLHPTLGRAPVVQGVLIVQMSERKKMDQRFILFLNPLTAQLYLTVPIKDTNI